MKIEIWSDVVCPFCYIGKRRLEKALLVLGMQGEVQWEWKSYLLDPEAPTDSQESSLENLAKKKGWSMEQTLGMAERVTAVAEEEGLVFNMGSTRHANTFQAHRLIQLSKQYGRTNEVEERLFKAFFTEGEHLGNMETLWRLGKEAGLSEDALKVWKEDSKLFSGEIEQDLYEARQVGVTGVPFFVFNHTFSVTGAQPLATFMEALIQVPKDD